MCIAKTADTANRGKCIAAWNLEGTVGRYGTDQGIWRRGGTSYTGTEQRTGISTGIIVPAALLRRRLQNISRRLNLLYGEKAEMRIVSGENLLTSVEIILPRSSQDEEEKYDENNDCR